MSALTNSLNAKVKTAQAAAQIQQVADEKKAAKERAAEVKKGTADATARIPEIKKELEAAAEKGEKTLRLSIASPGDKGELTRRASAEVKKLTEHFTKKGLTVVRDYHYESGSGDSFYGGPHYDHYLRLAW